jgi:cytidylate kinase
MTAPVITVARSLGAGGEEVAELVARALSYRVVDEEILARAAEKADLPKDAVEDAERTRPLLSRILAAFAQAQAVESVEFGGPPLVTPPSPPVEKLIVDEIREAAREGGVVICGHGACYALAGTPGLFRAMVTASVPARAKRIAEALSLPEQAAAKAIAESDNQRAEYLRRFYDVKNEVSIHYDLVVNTDNVPFGLAAELILAAARA